MSRIGKKPVYIPSGASVDIKDGQVSVKGAKGDLHLDLVPAVSVEQKKAEDGRDFLEVTVKDESADRPIWGTMRAHLANMMHGVTEGWVKALELNGVGFKMKVQGKGLVLNLGFSHEINYELPEGVDAAIEGNVLTFTGIDKQLVGKAAAEVRAFKKPEPYKGKGFRYTDEVIRRKAGKAAKTE